MIAKIRRLALTLFLVLPTTVAAEDGFAVKTAKSAPPKELSQGIKKLLPSEAIVFVDDKGKTIAEIWLREEIAVEGSADQLKTASYRTLPQSTLFGAVRFHQKWRDYRKQKVQPDVYTLRLGFQPADGDHVGASKYTNFLCIAKASKDKEPGPLSYDDLIDMSSNAVGTTHPGCFMLFPVEKPGDSPKIVKKPMNHWVLEHKHKLTAGEKSTHLGIGLALVGSAGF